MDPEKGIRLTKKEKQRISREKSVQQKLKQQQVSRRGFLKAIIPGGWVPEAIRVGGLGNLSNAGKVSLIKDAALTSSSIGLGLKLGGFSKEQEDGNFKNKVLKFGWKDVEDSSKLQNFVSKSAEEYIKLTKTSRLTQSELISQITFCRSNDEFIKTVKTLNPNYHIVDNLYGYSDYKTQKLVIDLEGLRKQSTEMARTEKVDPDLIGGKALLDTLWHEWSHLDVTERSEGKNLNNPEIYFGSPVSLKNEQWRKYRGMAVDTDTYYGYIRLDEVIVETINFRRISEQLGLDEVFAAGNYYQNGMDVFSDFTKKTGISIETLYQAHATSDFEGLATTVGNNLPGNEDPFFKGVRLFTAIHQANPDKIDQTGIRSVVK